MFLAAQLLLCSPFASAQAVSGAINGTVLDMTGAVIPDANLTITDRDRGAIYRIKSDAQGNFSQTHLLAGNYQLKLESPGFAAFVANASVQVDATTRVDATIAPTGKRTEITVTTETPLLISDRAEIETTLTGPEIEALPVLDRNVRNLVPLIPGAQLNSWQHGISENPQQGVNVNVNGQVFPSNGFLLDGTENHSAILGIAVINPSLDSLQDFKVSTSNYDAEFGSAAGALVQATTKSDTNQIHGSLFEFLRNSAANAADPFTLQNPPLRWNQFGGSFGGSIRKDRIFVFGDYQGIRRRTGGSLITTVPTQAERNGDLSGLLGQYMCADGSVSSTNCASPAP
ncbi:MAG TPA: carboxypeptidase-like regulatory domain-containing protein [Bryobacteraceae bacterium]|nr:carboxypeptidase-like regulatory domain-containing protein [Bryobacteraceae bacterium]